MVEIDYMLDPGWPYLRQAEDLQLQEQAARRFDNKTHTWVADPKEGFVIAAIAVQEGNNYTLTMPDGSSKKINKEECQEINPAKLEKTEDMSNLTFLNEASVLHNLRQRYYSMMIYTYSGLFCVFINPYKLLPIYTDTVAAMYVNKRRAEMPPHLFAISDEAYRNMITDHENQSMLITGESGAGKTENTKKVIAYFAKIGAPTIKKDTEKKAVRFADVMEASLENQVVQANPAIEAFGNGATVRNYNSSRYGKFVRIHFDKRGKLVGGDIEHYLLEKSRVIRQAPGERSYHIFYQIFTQKKLRDRFQLGDDIRQFSFVSQAEISVPGMNDEEEFRITDDAFDVMHFTDKEKNDLYKACATILHMSRFTFRQKPREEQAEVDSMDSPMKAANLFGIDADQFISALVRPRIKVGTEWVHKGQNKQQVDWAVGTLAKAIYARMFTWLIKRVNRTLSANLDESEHYIGVLDIAGFEIFDSNSFEQLWINFVNEKLQQFFNHHMFVLEQEEYEREGIQWQFIDFGLDLQSCIDLIEKPLGIISMLDEECIVPKATDMTYVDKLTNQHLGKHPNFQKAKPPKGNQAPAHFAVVHYAGTVRYNADQWLDKNKDPLNDSAVAVLKTCDKSSLIYQIWEDYMTDVDREESASRGKAQDRKKGKSASFLTVSSMYRESLASLMTMLHTTHPHFIRCIIPNEKKTSGLIDAPLVLNQLTCNGVLEGIRICRKGFPNRMTFADFRFRYAILAADEAAGNDVAEASKRMLERLTKENKIKDDMFKVGSTKVFFRAGTVAKMEELRDAALAKMIVKLQCAVRCYLAQCHYQQLLQQQEAYGLIQRNVRQWTTLRLWPWYRLFIRLRPMLKGMKSNAEVEALERKVKELEESSKNGEVERKRFEEELRVKTEQYEESRAALDRERMLMAKRNQEIEELYKSLKAETEKFEEEARRAKELEKEKAKEQKEWAEKEKRMQMEAEAEAARAKQLNDALTAELKSHRTENQKLMDQRKAQEMENIELTDRLHTLQEKYDRAETHRNRLQEDMEKFEEKYLAEQRQKDELAKANKKLENHLKTVQQQLTLLQHEKHSLDLDSKRKEEDIGQLKTRAANDANLIAKLKSNIRRLIDRIQELEDDLDLEKKSRCKADHQRMEMQTELEALQCQMEEVTGQLTVQVHINRIHAEELANLQREIELKNISRQSYIADICSMQYSTVNNLRTLSKQAANLESEAGRVLSARHSIQNLAGVPRVYLDSADSEDEESSI
nr:Myosin and Myosin head and IQ calmodulin-binding region and Myosin tail domain containing protein [Haemonchus contortus]